MSSWLRPRWAYSEPIGHWSDSRVLQAAHTTAHTRGSYTELSTGLPRPASGLVIHFNLANDWAFDYQLDLAIGGAGSEVNILENITLSSAYGSYRMAHHIFLPITIPAGVRVSYRMQTSSSNREIQVGFVPVYGSNWLDASYQYAKSYGADTAATAAVLVDPGATSLTWGSWNEIAASTERDHGALLVCASSNANTSPSICAWHCEIGVGAASSEVVLSPPINMHIHNVPDNVNAQLFFFECVVPKGTRLSARMKCDITDATDRLLYISLLGFS